MEEIEAISAGASELLTHALLMREKEVSDAETYNGMIQVRSRGSLIRFRSDC